MGETDLETTLIRYRIIQESITNAVRHNGGRTTHVQLTRTRGRITAAVRDDGHGFSPHASHRGSGLYGMQSRAQAHHGTWQISSDPNTGTTITAQLPARRTRGRTTVTSGAGGHR